MAQSSSELGTWCDAGHSPTGFDSPCEHVKVDHSSTIQRQSSGVQTIMPVQGNLNSMSNPVNTKRKMSAFSEIRKQATSWVQQHATPICRRGTVGKPKACGLRGSGFMQIPFLEPAPRSSAGSMPAGLVQCPRLRGMPNEDIGMT